MKKLLLLSYSILLISFTLFSYLFIDPNLSYFKSLYSGFAFDHKLETSILYIVLVTAYFIFYLLFLNLLKRNKLSKGNLKWILILTVLISLFSYPAMLSYDVFNYIITSKVVFSYHENPYIIMPIQFAGDPLLAFTHAANKIALYGPSWITLSAFPYLLGFGNFIITLFNFKLAAAIFYLLTTWLIYKMTKNFLSVAIFSLNPLVVIETLISGHNDIVMMFFAVFALLLISRKKIILAFVFLLVSALIKYSTIFLLPVFIYLAVAKKEINWQKIYLSCAFLMFIPFILSPIREEIYPWYAIWFLLFTALVPKNKSIFILSLAFSFSLLLRYVPFMLLGTYSYPTPIIKTILTFVPVSVAVIYLLIKKKLWSKRFYLL